MREIKPGALGVFVGHCSTSKHPGYDASCSLEKWSKTEHLVQSAVIRNVRLNPKLPFCMLVVFFLSFSICSTSVNQILAAAFFFCLNETGASKHPHPAESFPNNTNNNSTINTDYMHLASHIYACLASGQVEPNPGRPLCDSPLCSPKNTSLNFLRGFPRSPPADMAADRELNSADCSCFLVARRLLCGVCAGGDAPLLTG